MRVFCVLFWLSVAGMALLPTAACAAEVKDMEISRRTGPLEINVHFPALGVTGVDADLAQWAENTVQGFEQDYGQEQGETAEAPAYSLHITYEISRPSDKAASVVFKVESYTGGAHGALDIIVRSYDLQTGLPLLPPYLFEDVETALNLMSTYSYDALSQKLGPNRAEDMLRSGTTPDADNFAALALQPGGVRIYFQPYQVGPWVIGPQTVDMPLDALLEAHPQLEWWGRVEAGMPRAGAPFETAPGDDTIVRGEHP